MGGRTPEKVGAADEWKVSVEHEEDGGPAPAGVVGPDQGGL